MFNRVFQEIKTKLSLEIIPNSSQKSRNVKSYTHKALGSCYMFKYEDAEESKGIIIDGVELTI